MYPIFILVGSWAGEEAVRFCHKKIDDHLSNFGGLFSGTYMENSHDNYI